MQLIVSTCGTSIFTADTTAEIRQLLTNHANEYAPGNIPSQPLAAIQGHVVQRVEELATLTHLETLTRRSAELNGLASFYGATLNGKDHHILLATDTWLGEQAAQAIASVMQRHGHSTEVKRVQDLRTNDLPAYRSALSELVQWAYSTFPDYRARGYGIIFNLTGGFKAVQGFMQTLGMLHADECVYVYERSAELIRLPRLPIKMQADGFVRDHLAAFRRMAAGLPVPAAEVQLVPEALLFIIDAQAALSEWGEVVWREIREEMYAGKLHPSPSPRLTWGDTFERNVHEKEHKGRLGAINAKIDDLARYLETQQATLSLDFKIIRGGPLQGATHEIDAWHDGDAKRIYGHFDSGVFVVDRLGAALH